MDSKELLDEKTMEVTDDEGNKHLLNILFTYDNEERGTSYVFFYEENNPDEVSVMRYVETEDGAGSLEMIEDEEEYAEVEEVFEAWDKDPEIQKLKEE